MIDAVFAKFAAPGMCNPDDQTPCVTGEPTEDVARRDLRSHRQRHRDALSAVVRSQLGNPELGTHRGLPVTVIISATLQDLQDKTGHGVTAGGTLLPMTDVIRMASHAYHYLTLFDGITGRAPLPRAHQTHRHRRPTPSPALHCCHQVMGLHGREAHRGYRLR